MTAASRLRSVLQSIAEGLMFSLLFCLLGALTLQIISRPKAVKEPPAVMPRSGDQGSGQVAPMQCERKVTIPEQHRELMERYMNAFPRICAVTPKSFVEGERR